MRLIRANWDVAGSVASGLCAVHCVLSGFALGLLSVLGIEFLDSPVLEAAFVLSAFALGVVALVHGRRKHHSFIPAGVFVLGLGAIVSAHVLFEHGAREASVLSIIGGSCLIAFHWLNFKLAKACNCSDCRH